MGASLSASPEAERLSSANADLNVAEAMLVRDLPGASARRAVELAGRVRWAKREFDAALSALREASDFPTAQHVDEDPKRSMQEDAVCW